MADGTVKKVVEVEKIVQVHDEEKLKEIEETLKGEKEEL